MPVSLPAVGVMQFKAGIIADIWGTLLKKQ